MTLRLNGSTSGYTEIDAPAVAGSNTITLPTGNGTAGQVLQTNGSGALSFVDRMTAAGPAFAARSAGAQTITSGVQTKVNLPTEVFDTANCYDASSYRFTPNVAGYYQVNMIMQYTGTSEALLSAMLFSKNGSLEEVSVIVNSTFVRLNSCFLTYLNGSTDFIEMFVSHNSVGTRTYNNSFFQGFLARPA